MKNLILKINASISIVFFLISTVSAQFQITPGTFGEFGSTQLVIRGIGIGNFPPNQITDAALHINTFYMTPSSNYPGINFGDVFKTQSPTALIHAWRMFIGSGSGTQIFNIKNDNTLGSNNVSIESFQNDGSLIFNTSPNAERMRIYDQNFVTNQVIPNPGMVRIGLSGGADPNGFGPLREHPNLLVVGSDVSVISPFANYTVAEFRSAFDQNSSTGIKIRGSRFTISDLCVAHIDLSNFDNDEGPTGKEYILTRLCSDMQTNAGQLGFFHIETREDPTTLSSKFLIDNKGFTGVGKTFNMVGTTFNGPLRRLHVDDAADAPQFRISQSYDLDPALGVFTDFQTTAAGDLCINPQNAATDKFVGINLSAATPPTSTLDINGDLRIRNIAANPALTSVLVVDANGLVQSRTLPNSGNVAACLSGLQNNYVTKITNSLTNEICNSQIFDDGTTVKIVHSPPAALGFVNIKNDLFGSGYTAALQVENTNNAMGSALVLAGKFRAMYAVADGQFGGNEKGIETYAQGSSSSNSNNTGTYSMAKNATTNNMGVAGYGYSYQGQNIAVNNIGVFGKANGASSFNAGIYGDIGTLGAGNWAGYFLGPVMASSYSILPSDAAFKKNIKSIEGALDKILLLKPATYEYDTEKFSYKNFYGGTTPGFIADEVAEIIPEIVKKCNDPVLYDSLGNQINEVLTYNGLQIDGIIPYLVAAIQELNSKVDGCCNSGMRLQDQGNNPSQSIKIISEATALLGDARPNPADGNTIITVKVPEKISEAIIVFTDQLGKEVFREAITNRGYSDLNIETLQLEQGGYHYSLIADGKIIDTKQMVKQH